MRRRDGVSEVEKPKRQKGVCHAKTTTTHLVFNRRKETAETDQLIEDERDGESVEGMIKRTVAIMMRPLTGRTLSPSSLLSSVSTLL